MKVTENDLGIINIRGLSEILLGREESNYHVLLHPAVSAQHARIERKEDGSWWVFDLNSDHGTFINNQQVGQEGLPIIPEKDTLWIAPYAFKLSENMENIEPNPAHLRLDTVNLQRKVNHKILLDLQGTPLTFRPGEFISIVGGSGAGKSTFLKALLGMDTIPENGRSGDVYFNNQRLINDAEVRTFGPINTILGYVPQQDDSVHFQLTAFEALNFSARLRFAQDFPADQRKEKVKQALDIVKLDREELQNKPVSQLSGGQKKRVNVAMELVAEPRLLFLDEPTSGLDPGLDLEIMQLLKSWARGSADQDPKTILLITHATENVRLCDYIVFLGRVISVEQERGGCLIFFGDPNQEAEKFFNKEKFSEIYRLIDNPQRADHYHEKMFRDPEFSQTLWKRSRNPRDIQQSLDLDKENSHFIKQGSKMDWGKIKRQWKILTSRYWLLSRRDAGAFVFQLFQGVLVALLLWIVAAQDAFTAAGVRAAPTTLFILSISATWLGILNASKEIVKERRIYGRERRYGIDPVAYVLSKFSVLGGLGVLQMASLVILSLLWFFPETNIGTFGRLFPEVFSAIFPLGLEWFITLELMLLSGISCGLCISSFSRSIDQATMFMFPAMLIQILLAGILFDVGPLAWLAFTHWGLQSLGNSLDLQNLFYAAGKAGDPILEKINVSGNVLNLLGMWLLLTLFIIGLLVLTCWRQSRRDKARIPED